MPGEKPPEPSREETELLREEVALEGDILKLAFTPEGIRLIQIAAKPFDVFVPS